MKRLFAKKPAVNVELSDKHIKTRGIFAIIFLVIGLVAIGFFLFSLLGKQSGWQEIELTNGPAEVSQEITLTYNIGASGFAASAEYKTVAGIYSDAATKAYQSFDVYEEYDSVVNLYVINSNPNKEYTVSPVLYKAFELLEKYQSRYQYLGAIYTEYGSFLVETQESAAELDPYKTQETADYYAEVSAFANSPDHIKVELLGDNKVKLFVSQEYLNFAKQNGIDRFVDFSWIQNAFIIDAVADELIAQGHFAGNLASEDGFVRNLDPTANKYSYNFYAVSENIIYPAARLDYTGADSIVAYRDYPIYDDDLNLSRYFSFKDGSILTLYIDPQDGKYKSACRNMTFHSDGMGVAELALATAPAFITDEVDEALLKELGGKGITSVWSSEDYKIKQIGSGFTALAFDNSGTVFEIQKTEE